MFERILQRFRALVRDEEYVMTLHALDEMEDDHLSLLDVETCVLTGSIRERQLDRETGDWKYVVEGEATSGARCVVVAKLTPAGKLGILTVFALEG